MYLLNIEAEITVRCLPDPDSLYKGKLMKIWGETLKKKKMEMELKTWNDFLW